MDNDGSRIKQTQAAAWGNSAEQYAADVHEGAGIMMPLIAAYAETAKEEVKGNPQILDVASGTGEPGISLAKLFPGGTVTMTDIAEGMIAGAKGRADRLSLKNTRYCIVLCHAILQDWISCVRPMLPAQSFTICLQVCCGRWREFESIWRCNLRRSDLQRRLDVHAKLREVGLL